MGQHENFGQLDVRIRQALDFDDSLGTPTSTRAGILFVPSSGKWAPREVLLVSDYGAAGGVAPLDGAADVPMGNLPVAASGTSSSSALVRADDTRLSNARTPTSHSHAIGDLPVASSGASSSTALVRADDTRLSNTRTPAAHSSTHASNGSDPITPASIGAVATSARGPFGGVQAQTLAAGTYSIDATSPNTRRFTLTGDITISVPTSGTETDGQRIVFWLLASGATRKATFASGYETSPAVPLRLIPIVSGSWVMIEAECRSGTWRLVQSDNVPSIVAEAYLSTAYTSLAAGDYLMSGNMTVLTDRYGMFALNDAYRVTPALPGRFDIDWHAMISHTSGYAALKVMKNGAAGSTGTARAQASSLLSTQSPFTTSGEPNQPHIHGSEVLAATDYLNFGVYCSATFSMPVTTFGGIRTKIVVRYTGPE